MRRLLPLSLFLLPLFVPGCGVAPQPRGVLRVAQEGDPGTLDPARAYDTGSISFVRVLYRGLVEYDFDAKIQPELAEKYTVSPDGKTYRFWIRSNARFWDKTPVKSTDFRCGLERALDPITASDGSSFFTGIAGAKEWVDSRKTKNPIAHVAGIECPSPRELVIRLSEPDATFISRLTLPFSYAVPEHYIEKLRREVGDGKALSQRLSQHPMGNGPFKLADWVRGSSLKMVRNTDYFRPGLPKADVLDAQFGISSSLQSMLFEQGALDTLDVSKVFPSDFLRVKNSPKWKGLVESAPMMDIRYMAMNTEIAPFKDVRVRQAVCYAVNRDRIVSFLTGRATKARGALPESVQSYDPKLFSYPYDPAKAKQLLKEAGFKSPGPLQLLYSLNEPWYAKAAQGIQEDLAAVGIEVTLKGVQYPDLKVIAGKRGKDGGRFVIQGWSQDFPDPSNYLDPLFNGRSIAPTARLNRSFYSNSKVNALLDAALKMPNGEARWKKYQEAQRLIVHDAPVVFLHNTQRYVVRQPRVTGFRLHPAWSSTYEFLGTN